MGYSPWGRKELNMTEQLSLSPKDAPALILKMCSPYLLKNFAGVIKLRILRWVDYSGFFRWPIVITVVLIRGDRRVRVRDGDCNSRSSHHISSDAAMSQGRWAASRFWKRQGTDSP